MTIVAQYVLIAKTRLSMDITSDRAENHQCDQLLKKDNDKIWATPKDDEDQHVKGAEQQKWNERDNQICTCTVLLGQLQLVCFVCVW